MSTSRMYLAQGMSPDRPTLQWGNIRLEDPHTSAAVHAAARGRWRAAGLALLPARFGDDHLGSDVVEGLPELRLLQAQPDVALQVGVWCHGGRSGAAEARLQVCRQRSSFRASFHAETRRRRRRRLTSDGLHASAFRRGRKQEILQLLKSMKKKESSSGGGRVAGLLRQAGAAS